MDYENYYLQQEKERQERKLQEQKLTLNNKKPLFGGVFHFT